MKRLCVFSFSAIFLIVGLTSCAPKSGSQQIQVGVPRFTLTPVSGDGQAGPTGQKLPHPLVVDVRDGVGLPRSGVAVYFYDYDRSYMNEQTVWVNLDGRARAYVSPPAVGPATVSVVLLTGGVSNVATFTVHGQ